jgi:hypothetical protein
MFGWAFTLAFVVMLEIVFLGGMRSVCQVGSVCCTFKPVDHTKTIIEKLQLLFRQTLKTCAVSVYVC